MCVRACVCVCVCVCCIYVCIYVCCIYVCVMYVCLYVYPSSTDLLRELRPMEDGSSSLYLLPVPVRHNSGSKWMYRVLTVGMSDYEGGMG